MSRARSPPGFHVPSACHQRRLEKLMDTTDEWIVERTGIHDARFARPPGRHDLAVMAARKALADAGRTPAR